MLIAADFVLILLQNLFFTDLVGISSVSRASKGKFTLLLHGLLVMLFCILSAGLTAAVRGLLPNNTQVLLFPLLNAAFCGITDLLICVILRQISIRKYARIAPQIHAAACSGAVLGAVLLSTGRTAAAAAAMRIGFETGLGYLFACAALMLAMPALRSEHIPEGLRGWKAIFLYAAMLSMTAACLFQN